MNSGFMRAVQETIIHGVVVQLGAGTEEQAWQAYLASPSGVQRVTRRTFNHYVADLAAQGVVELRTEVVRGRGGKRSFKVVERDADPSN